MSAFVFGLFMSLTPLVRGQIPSSDLGYVCYNSEYANDCGYVPHPTQCDKYIQCLHGNGTYIVKSCPDGLHWDAARETCNLPCEANCAANIFVNCNRKWVAILETKKDGETLLGSKLDLQEAVRYGSRVKFTTSTYSAEFDNCQVVGSDVCCQALFYMSKSDWNNFRSNIYWLMLNTCTTGNWHMIRYYEDGGYLSETKTTEGFTWFVLRDENGRFYPPVYSTSSTGEVTNGNIYNVVYHIYKGSSVSIVTGNKAVFPIQNIRVYPSSGTPIVSAQHVWSVSQKHVGNYLEFQPNAYWWFIILASTGSRDMSRWNLGFHTSRGHTNDVTPMNWFVDECWQEVYSSSNGESSEDLMRFINLVKAGHSIRVRFGNITMEADNIRLSQNQASAQLIPSLDRANAFRFESGLNWDFRLLATTGRVQTYHSVVGTDIDAAQETTTEHMMLTWYVDTKNWKKLFHILADGSVVSGSPIAVRHAVEEGADIRVGYKLPGDHGFRYSKADNIEFGPSPHLAVQLVRLLRDHMDGPDEFKLDSNPVWTFKILDTRGNVQNTDWVVGEHANDGRSSQMAEIKFFAYI